MSKSDYKIEIAALVMFAVLLTSLLGFSIWRDEVGLKKMSQQYQAR